MNNQIPFFNPFNPNNYQPSINANELERLEEKIERLEKNIRILDNRIKKLENSINHQNKNDYYSEEPTDMYMI